MTLCIMLTIHTDYLTGLIISQWDFVSIKLIQIARYDMRTIGPTIGEQKNAIQNFYNSLLTEFRDMWGSPPIIDNNRTLHILRSGHGSVIMRSVNMSAGVAPEVNLGERTLCLSPQCESSSPLLL